MKTAIYSTHLFERDHLAAAAGGQHELVFIGEPLSAASTQMSAGCTAIALFTSDDASAGVLETIAANGIKYITLRSAGHDHVDLEKARSLGIKVANVPAYSPYAIAEHAVTLLMALNRKIVRSQELVMQHDFRIDELTGFDVHGKTVGIVGLGKIGEAFARIMKGFGCRILVYDPTPNHVLAQEIGLDFVTLGEVCKLSDIISIHCPLTPATRHLFDRHAFCLMKKNVHLINTARGAVINTDDLLQALDQGRLGAVGLDVYEFEKGLFFRDHRASGYHDARFEKLLSYPNVLITSHQAFLTTNALQNIAETTMYNLGCFEQGQNCCNQLI